MPDDAFWAAFRSRYEPDLHGITIEVVVEGHTVDEARAEALRVVREAGISAKLIGGATLLKTGRDRWAT